MYKILSIIYLTLLISASLAKQKTATEQAADAAANLKDKVVETVCWISFSFH
jgi:hypothetical protein